MENRLQALELATAAIFHNLSEETKKATLKDIQALCAAQPAKYFVKDLNRLHDAFKTQVKEGAIQSATLIAKVQSL
jgi:hypothetical protein